MCWMMVPVVLLGAVIVIGGSAVAVIVIAWLAPGSGQQVRPAETPLAILKRRYAQGEISSEQFEAAKRQLSEPDQRKES
jgi:putative membrane protein